jgi:hypothetical protein
MEMVALSRVVGAVRVGLHVVSRHRRPVLEVYHEMRNDLGPSEEIRIPCGPSGEGTEAVTHRHQDIFLQFFLVNIGGVRAEDVMLSYSGDLDRNEPRRAIRDVGVFSTTIPQVAPGQVVFLFRLDEADLYTQPSHPERTSHVKEATFTITASYNGVNRGLNRIGRLWRRLRGGKQYQDRYIFDPRIVCTDLHAPQYAVC